MGAIENAVAGVIGALLVILLFASLMPTAQTQINNASFTGMAGTISALLVGFVALGVLVVVLNVFGIYRITSKYR